MNNETIPILNQPSIDPRAFDNLKPYHVLEPHQIAQASTTALERRRQGCHGRG
ncbi:hypothetical protein [Ferrimicrobium sp.]|uniref:hypothetical protein n=1 Tax=Ferrimicrobium sp. TaxID=2926050 RepID=UPI00261A8F92|nr:hypothetical protein [Ferrimicrobium sp.]